MVIAIISYSLIWISKKIESIINTGKYSYDYTAYEHRINKPQLIFKYRYNRNY